MGAGAAVRTAWETIVRDYQAKREQEGTPLRYAYEEMALTLRTTRMRIISTTPIPSSSFQN